MKAAVITGHGGPDVLEIADVPRPAVPADHVLIAVRAAALNHLDLWVRNGLPGLDLDFPFIGGSDIAGVVAELGEDVDGFSVGDRVLVNPGLWDGECEWCRKGEESLCVSYALLGEHVDGGFAEFASVPARNLLTLPDTLAFEAAAAVPLVFQTAWRALMTRAALQPHPSVLITGASGGVASAAIQIARLAGATVYAVTSGEANVERARQLGADYAIDRESTSFADEIRRLTEVRGVDVVLDSVGEAIWSDLIRCLARDGCLVTYGATTGPHAELDIRRVFWKQLRVIGSTMASKAEFEHVMSLVFENKLRPIIDSVLPFERVREAYQRLEDGDVFGKIVLSFQESA